VLRPEISHAPKRTWPRRKSTNNGRKRERPGVKVLLLMRGESSGAEEEGTEVHGQGMKISRQGHSKTQGPSVIIEKNGKGQEVSRRGPGGA